MKRRALHAGLVTMVTLIALSASVEAAGAQAPAGRSAAGMSARAVLQYADSVEARCLAADFGACIETGRLHLPLAEDDSTLVTLPPKKRSSRTAVLALTSACDAAGSALSCVRLGHALKARTKEAKWGEPLGPYARFEQGCAKGAGSGCIARAETINDWAVKVPWLEQGCALRAVYGCATAGHVYSGYFVGVQRVVKPDSAKALRNYDAACALGDQLSCRRYGPRLLVGAGDIAPDTARAVALMRAACRGGVPDNCMALGELMIARGDTATARGHFDRACEVRHVEGCERLVALAEGLPGSTALEEARARAVRARALRTFGPIAGKAGTTFVSRSPDQRYVFRMAIDVIRDGRALVLDEALDVGRGILLIAVEGRREFRVANQMDPDTPPTAMTFRARREPNGDILVWHGARGYLYRPEAARIRKQPVIIAADGSYRAGLVGARQTPGADGWWSEYYPSSQSSYVAAAAYGEQRKAEVRAQQGRGAALLGAAVGAAAGAYVGADAATTTQMMAAGATAVDPNSAVSRGLSTAAAAAPPPAQPAATQPAAATSSNQPSGQTQAGTATATPPAANGRPLRIVLWIPLKNRPTDTWNPSCYSTIITRPGPPGWGLPGFLPSGSAEQARAVVNGLKAEFIALCQRASGREVASESSFSFAFNQSPDDEARLGNNRARNAADVTVTIP